ncbi:MAG: NAD(P)-dependent oxidoreductase [Promethearchaeota archaeon]
MQSINVLFLWKVPDPLRDYLQKNLSQIKGLNLIFPEEAEESEFLKWAPEVHVIVGWRPSKDLLEQAQQLQLFLFPGVGVQNFIEWFQDQGQKRGIVLVNSHGNSYLVAQHTVALLLSLLNKVVPHHNWMKAGEWRKGDSDAKTVLLRHRTIGFLGYGAINQQVHRFLVGFDVEFVALRRSWNEKNEVIPTPIKKYETAQLDEFLDAADTLLVAVPLTPETEDLIGFNELKRLGPEGVVVNVGRGPVINQKALYEALVKHHILGAAIDVWYTYQPDPDEKGRKYPFEEPFQDLDNIILSPHRAYSPADDLERWDEVIENIKRFADGRTDYISPVDYERGY